MYTSTTAKSDHIDSFNNAQNRMLMNYERDEFEQAPLPYFMMLSVLS